MMFEVMKRGEKVVFLFYNDPKFHTLIEIEEDNFEILVEFIIVIVIVEY